MDFLRRSGRVSAVVASIGSILQIKPIVTVLEKGKVEAVHRIRTFSKAKDKLKELLDAEGTLDRLAIIHTQNEAGAREFMEEHRSMMPQNTIITEVGPTLGTHIGLNSLGFVSVRK
jgi:DegV family protein with EDD domain